MLLSKHVIAGDPNFNTHFSAMKSHIIQLLHLHSGRKIFWTVEIISYNLFYYLEQVKMHLSCLSRVDFSAINIGEDFETILTTSLATFCRSGCLMLSAGLFVRTLQKWCRADTLVIQ
jgi:hypothetical protein